MSFFKANDAVFGDVGFPIAADTTISPGNMVAMASGYAETATDRRLTARESVYLGSPPHGGGQGEVETVAGPVGVDADQTPVGVDQRASRRTAAERGRVLDAIGDQPAPRTTKAAIQ